MTKKFTYLALIAAACVLISACGASAAKTTTHKRAAPKTTKPLSGHATVTIRNFNYHPDTLVVTPGTTVTFHNYDQTAHTATALDGAFNTGTIQPGKSATIKVGKAGTYKYHCLFHAFMTGSIVVSSKSAG